MLQQSAMMTLGYFVFMRQTIPYTDLGRELSWNHPTNSVVGALPRSQFTGKSGEEITLSCTLAPEVTGGSFSMLALEMMAEKGTAYPLISGSTFLVLGWFVIEKISVQSSVFFGDGTPRRIDFSMTLKRVDDSILADIVDEVLNYF